MKRADMKIHRGQRSDQDARLRLVDETGAAVQSEKLLEIDFAGKKIGRAGNQFGLGGVTK